MENAIIEAILADADMNAEKTKNKTAKIIEKMNTDFAAEKEFALKNLAEEIKEKAEKIYDSETAKREQDTKNALLKTKVNAIKTALRDAKKEILTMSDDEYADYFRKKYEQVKRDEPGVVYLNRHDKQRIKKSVFGGSRISEECIKTDGGFVLEYAEIEHDCRIDSLFEEKYTVLCDAVNKIYSEEQ